MTPAPTIRPGSAPFVAAARERKVSRMLAAVLLVAPKVNPRDIADKLRSYSDDEWSVLAGAAKVNFPSEDTRELLIERLVAL